MSIRSSHAAQTDRSVRFSFLLFLGFFLFSRSQFMEVVIQVVETFDPELAILFYPVGNFFQRASVKLAGPPLCRTSAGDQLRVLQNFKVFGDGRKTHVKRLGEFGDRNCSAGEASQDGAARGVSESGKSRAKRIG